MENRDLRCEDAIWSGTYLVSVRYSGVDFGVCEISDCATARYSEDPVYRGLTVNAGPKKTKLYGVVSTLCRRRRCCELSLHRCLFFIFIFIFFFLFYPAV
jgi:hypothetical protein